MHETYYTQWYHSCTHLDQNRLDIAKSHYPEFWALKGLFRLTAANVDNFKKQHKAIQAHYEINKQRG